jgi:hypothetical protein
MRRRKADFEDGEMRLWNTGILGAAARFSAATAFAFQNNLKEDFREPAFEKTFERSFAAPKPENPLSLKALFFR